MPTNEDGIDKPYIMTSTEDIKLVADYTRMSFYEALELDCITFRELVRDAFIFKMRETKEGQDYLEDCWTMTQTAPDRKKLRQQFGKGGAK